MASIISAGTSAGTALNLTGDTSGALQLATNNGTTAVTIDTAQNVGIGATPNTWTAFRALQIGAASYTSNGNQMTMGANWYYNGGDKYINTAPASVYSSSVGQHRWYSAPSGTADSAMTLTQTMTLDASGNLGIGTTSPSSQNSAANLLVVGSNSLGNTGMTLAGGASSQVSLFFSKGTGSSAQQAAGYLYYLNSSDNMVFGTANTERMRLNNSGTMILQGGNSSATGVGITFPASQSASTDANTLDDYEEGTWTPYFQNTTATYTSPTEATYVKIGRQVFVSFVVTTATLTQNAGAFEIAGLPFVNENVQAAFSPISIFPETGMNTAVSAGNMYGLVIQGASYVRLYTISSSTGNNYTTVNYNDLQTGTNRIRIAACYRTS